MKKTSMDLIFKNRHKQYFILCRPTPEKINANGARYFLIMTMVRRSCHRLAGRFLCR